MGKSMSVMVLGVVLAQQDDAGSLLQVQKHSQIQKGNDSLSTELKPWVTDPSNGYRDLGMGKCKGPGGVDMANEKNGITRHYWRPDQASTCAKQCDEMGCKCAGYSISSSNNCLLWANKINMPLENSGTNDWGSGRCFVKTNLPKAVLCDAASGYELDALGKCKGPKGVDMANKDGITRHYWKPGQASTCAKQCDEMGCKCAGYSISSFNHCLLWANKVNMPLKGSGTNDWGGASCFIKKDMPNAASCDPAPGYKQIGLGKCKGPGGKDMGDYSGGFWYVHGNGPDCAKTCDELKKKCGGYSVSGFNNCLLWANLEGVALEPSNRNDWGDAHCMVKNPMPEPSTEPPPTPRPTTVAPPEPEEPEEPVVPPSSFPAQGYRCPYGTEHRIGLPVDYGDLEQCESLCASHEECAYYSHTEKHAGLNGRKRCVLCKASVETDRWGKADSFTTYQIYRDTVKRYEGEEDVCPVGWEGVKSPEECEEIASMGLITVPNGDGKPPLKGFYAREETNQNRPKGCYIRNSDRSIQGVDSERGDKNHGRMIWNHHGTGKKNKWSNVICVEKACR